MRVRDHGPINASATIGPLYMCRDELDQKTRRQDVNDSKKAPANVKPLLVRFAAPTIGFMPDIKKEAPPRRRADAMSNDPDGYFVDKYDRATY